MIIITVFSCVHFYILLYVGDVRIICVPATDVRVDIGPGGLTNAWIMHGLSENACTMQKYFLF